MLKFKFLQLVEMIVLVVLVVLPIRFFLFEPFFVLGDSMLPSYESYDYLVIEKISYRLRSPARGEVVIFRPPVNPRVYYIKRVLGIPGDTISIRDGKVFRQAEGQKMAQPVEEPYLGGNFTPGRYDFQLGPSEFFVLGDNRNESYDSRRWGPVVRGSIIGRVLVRVVPLREIVKFVKFGFAK